MYRRMFIRYFNFRGNNNKHISNQRCISDPTNINPEALYTHHLCKARFWSVIYPRLTIKPQKEDGDEVAAVNVEKEERVSEQHTLAQWSEISGLTPAQILFFGEGYITFGGKGVLFLRRRVLIEHFVNDELQLVRERVWKVLDDLFVKAKERQGIRKAKEASIVLHITSKGIQTIHQKVSDPKKNANVVVCVLEELTRPRAKLPYAGHTLLQALPGPKATFYVRQVSGIGNYPWKRLESA
eukprot:PhM_4_TR3768/c0_g1_i1/m.42035